MDETRTGRALDAEIERVVFKRVCCSVWVGDELRFAKWGSIPPAYSADPDAQTLLEYQMCRLGFGEPELILRDDGRYAARFATDAWGCGDTEGEAVSRAALAALAADL